MQELNLNFLEALQNYNFLERPIENQRHATECCTTVLDKSSDTENKRQEKKVISSTFEINKNNWSTNIVLLNQRNYD